LPEYLKEAGYATHMVKQKFILYEQRGHYWLFSANQKKKETELP